MIGMPLYAHEVGHVLGLKHNMRASYAFPVDSLVQPVSQTKTELPHPLWIMRGSII